MNQQSRTTPSNAYGDFSIQVPNVQVEVPQDGDIAGELVSVPVDSKVYATQANTFVR